MSRCIAIMLSARGGKNRTERRTLAWSAFRSVAFRGCLRSMFSWLLQPRIPMRSKIREVILAPWKLWMFLSGRAEVAAIFDAEITIS